MRTLGKVLAGVAIVVVLLVAVAAIVAVSVSSDTLIAPVRAQVKAATGRDLTVAGTARIALGLPPHVVLTDVALANAPWASEPQMLKAQRLELAVELLPLLAKRIELSKIDVVGARIALETDAAGRRSWDLEAPGPARAPNVPSVPGLPAALAIGNVAIHDGVVTYRDGPKATPTQVTIGEMALRTRSVSGDVDVHFDGAVGELPVKVDGVLGPLAALVAQRWPYPVDVSGEIAGQKAKFAAKIRADGARYAFDDLALALGPNAIRGTFAVDNAGKRPRLLFDLTATALAFAALPAAVALPASTPPAAKPARAYLVPDMPVSFVLLRWVDAQGSLAIDKLTLSDGRDVGSVRARIALTDGRLEVSDLAMGLFGGTISGTLTVDARQPGSADITTRLEGKGMSLGAILAAAGHPRQVRGGRTDAVANLAFRGNSPHTWASSASGTFRLVSGSATLANSNIDALAMWDKLNDAVNPFRSRDSSTELVCVVVNLPLTNGVARVDRTMAMETSKIGVTASGTLDFRNETLDLAFAPRVRKGISIDFAGFSDLVRLSGPFASPKLAVDVAGSAKVIASVGAAIGTGGLSAVGQALLSWIDGSGPGPCQVALEGPRAARAETATAPQGGQAAVPIVDDIGKALGKLFGK